MRSRAVLVAALNLTILVVSSHRVFAVDKCEPPVVSHVGLDTEEFRIYTKVCVDQETLIMYDPMEVAKHPGEDGLPRVDVSQTQYFYRHASAQEVAEAVDQANHQPQTQHDFRESKPVVGSHTFNSRLDIRLPHKLELDNIPSEFSKCTVPFLIFTHWPMNMGEFITRVPAFLDHYQNRGVFGRDVSLVLATPMKLPLDTFNFHFMRPFSKYLPSSFADFSARLPSETPSNFTAEGRHVRCFEKLILWTSYKLSFPMAAPAGRTVVEYYRPMLPQIKAWDAVGLGPDALRVIIEQRPRKSARQFLEVDKLVEDCNKDGKIDVPGTSFTKVYCIVRSLGDEFLEDMAVLGSANTFVSFHGAGQNNVLFMPPQSSMLEVRPRLFGTKHKYWANFWQPGMSQETDRAFLWWGLNVENTALSPNSLVEELGLQEDEADNARDRFIILKWEHLKFMLGKIASVNGSKEAYEQIYPRVAYTIHEDLMVNESDWQNMEHPTRRRWMRRRMLRKAGLGLQGAWGTARWRHEVR